MIELIWMKAVMDADRAAFLCRPEEHVTRESGQVNTECRKPARHIG